MIERTFLIKPTNTANYILSKCNESKSLPLYPISKRNGCLQVEYTVHDLNTQTVALLQDAMLRKHQV